MHGRVARYRFTGDPETIARRVEEGLLPVFQSQHGFKAYSVFATEDEIMSFSAWNAAADAEAANLLAAEWVGENLEGEVELKESMIGQILLSTSLGVGTRAGAAV